MLQLLGVKVRPSSILNTFQSWRTFLHFIGRHSLNLRWKHDLLVTGDLENWVIVSGIFQVYVCSIGGSCLHLFILAIAIVMYVHYYLCNTKFLKNFKFRHLQRELEHIFRNRSSSGRLSSSSFRITSTLIASHAARVAPPVRTRALMKWVRR